AGRIGPLRPETAHLLDRFRIAAPRLVGSVYPRVGDGMTSPAMTARVRETPHEVRLKLDPLGMPPVAVVDGDGGLTGIAEARDFARVYFRGLDPDTVAPIPLQLDNIIRTLGGTVLVAAPDRAFDDRVTVAASYVETILARVNPGVILVV